MVPIAPKLVRIAALMVGIASSSRGAKRVASSCITIEVGP